MHACNIKMKHFKDGIFHPNETEHFINPFLCTGSPSQFLLIHKVSCNTVPYMTANITTLSV